MKLPPLRWTIKCDTIDWGGDKSESMLQKDSDVLHVRHTNAPFSALNWKI